MSSDLAQRTVTDKCAERSCTNAPSPAAHGSLTAAWVRYILHDELHWLDVPDRVFFELAVTVHRRLNGRAPPYLLDYCVAVASADTWRHLRSARSRLLAVPHFQLNIYGRRAFSVAGLSVWNSLLDFIQDPTISADAFRRLVKTYLFARY